VNECALCGQANATTEILVSATGFKEQKVLVCSDSLGCRRRAWRKMRELKHLANVAIGEVEK